MHFVINRVTSRHSFAFLDAEYRQNLAPLASGEKILGYLPYDRLVVETFGDYPFFSELLPKSLITKKIRLILWRLCSDPKHFPDIHRMRERGRRRLFRKTLETRLADPETILRAIVSIPIWLVIPALILLTLSLLSDNTTLSYAVLWQLIYLPIATLLFLVLALGVFEPIQISRWLLRVAKFRRRRRLLKKRYTRSIRLLFSILDAGYALVPSCFGAAFLIAFLWYSVRLIPSGFSDISIWKGTVSGFSAGGRYSGLHMAAGSSFLEGMNITGADFKNSTLSAVYLVHLIANQANFSGSDLTNSEIESSGLQSTNFERTLLSGASFRNSDLSNADFRSATGIPELRSFEGATLSGADFSGSTAPLSVLLFARLQGAKMDEGQSRAVTSWEKLNPGLGRSFPEIVALAPDSGDLDSAPKSDRELFQNQLRHYENRRSRELDRSIQTR